MSSSIFSGWVHDHPFYAAAHQAIKSEIDAVLAGGDPFVSLLLGPSGAGKSELSHDLCGDYSSYLGPQGHSQVMWLETPSKVTGEALPLEVSAALLGTLPPRCDRSQIRPRARSALRSAGVRLLFLDEVNHFVEARSTVAAQTKENRQIADWLKEIVEIDRISLVLMGLPHVRQLLFDNEQLQRRALNPIDLRPYAWMDAAEQTAFAQAVAAFSKRLQDSGWLISIPLEELVPRVYGCSGGLVGLVQKLFASVERVGADDRNLDLSVLSRAYKRAFHRPGFDDPFVGPITSEETLNDAHQQALHSAWVPKTGSSKFGTR